MATSGLKEARIQSVIARTVRDRVGPFLVDRRAAVAFRAAMLQCPLVQDLLRLLDVVRRELGANDARVEIGGRDPSPPGIWIELDGGARVVALFDEPPSDPDAKRAQLTELARVFGATANSVLADASASAPSAPRDAVAASQLFDALDALASRARAESAAVFDESSPEIWGSSLAPRGPRDMREAAQVTGAVAMARYAQLDLPALLDEAEPRLADRLMEDGILRPGQAIELEHRIAEMREAGARLRQPAAWRLAAALSKLRQADAMGMPRDDRNYVARPFGGIYRLVVVLHEKDASPMHAEAALIKALPVIESLVERLPPRDPGPGKGAVIRHLRPRRVDT